MVFIQVMFTEHFPSSDSSTSMQVVPLSVKLSRQVQVYERTVLLHLAFWGHGFTALSLHSSMSSHSIPFPENPPLQVQLYDSSVFLQVALA